MFAHQFWLLFSVFYLSTGTFNILKLFLLCRGAFRFAIVHPSVQKNLILYQMVEKWEHLCPMYTFLVLFHLICFIVSQLKSSESIEDNFFHCNLFSIKYHHVFHRFNGTIRPLHIRRFKVAALISGDIHTYTYLYM